MSLLYYSTQAALAHRICTDMYGRLYFVWCAPAFDTNIPTSNPKAIYEELRRITVEKDEHATKFEEVVQGLTRSIDKRKEAGVIDDVQAEAIFRRLMEATPADLLPMIYLIPRPAIDATAGRARQDDVTGSEEYVIEDLQGHEFEVIEGL